MNLTDAPNQFTQELTLPHRIERETERVRALQQELVDVGCETKDLTTGLVDFPAMFAGRKIWLCWKLGEPAIAWWHERDSGFAGRRPIDAEFRAGVRKSQASTVEPITPE